MAKVLWNTWMSALSLLLTLVPLPLSDKHSPRHSRCRERESGKVQTHRDLKQKERCTSDTEGERGEKKQDKSQAQLRTNAHPTGFRLSSLTQLWTSVWAQWIPFQSNNDKAGLAALQTVTAPFGLFQLLWWRGITQREDGKPVCIFLITILELYVNFQSLCFILKF